MGATRTQTETPCRRDRWSRSTGVPTIRRIESLSSDMDREHDKGYILYKNTSATQETDAKSEENNENGSPKDDQDTRNAASESQMFQEFVTQYKQSQ